MATPRDVLNELKWRHGALGEARIWYRHRGAPGDERVVTGDKVLDLGRSFFQVEGPMGGTMLPYHRVLRIEWGGDLVWEREGRRHRGGDQEGQEE